MTSSSNSAALALGTQRRVASLADGTVAVLDFDGSNTHLYQISAASSSSPSMTSVRQFSNMGSFYSLPDMHVVNNPDGTSDIWIADTTTVTSITHGRYAPATNSWTWDATHVVPGSTGSAFYVNVVWTGTRLIVAYNDGAPHALYYNWTTDLTGATGWSSQGSIQLSGGSNANVRPAPVLVHDSSVGATVCMYFIGTQVISRVLPDALSPLLANWGAEQNVVTAGVEVAVNYAYPYFNNHNAAIDARTGALHYVFCDGGNGPVSPGYMLGKITAGTRSISWSSPLAIGSPPLRSASSPAVAIDGSSKVYIFWATSPGSGSSDVMYTILTAPFTSAPAPTNLTNKPSGNNMQPHVPRGDTLSGYVPLVYVSAGTSAWGTSSPWAVVFDNTTLTATRSSADTAVRFRIAAPVRGLSDVHSRFSLVVPGTGFTADAPARFFMAANSWRNVGARFNVALRGRLAVFATPSNQALTLPSQRRVATLCDGSLAVLGWDGTSEHLYQVTNPGGSSPAVTSVQALTALNSFYALPDMLIVNNGSSTSDVWIADTTAVAAVQHGTYTAATKTWSWDARTSVPGSSGNAFYVQLAWTGTRLLCAYQDGSHAVFMNWTGTKNATSGWGSTHFQLSASGANSRPVIVLVHDAALGATVALYAINNQVISRLLPDALAPNLSNWGPEVAVLSAAVGSASLSGYAYAGNLVALIDPASLLVHVAFCDGSSATRSPGYLNGTATVDPVTPANNVIHWNAPIAVGSASASNSSPALAVDRRSKVFLFWANSTGGASSDVKYATLMSPYSVASGETNLTNNAAGNNTQPHLPRSEVLGAGYVPLLFESGAGNPFSVLLDTSVAAG
ncbi:MAG: hypothetical protein E6J20_04400 [Chloroflexi bacterium]|nr:MAG: hypothetical protein E6J20_04400 [Chloroflexota bacterium]